MTLKPPKNPRKRFLKLSLFTLGGLALLLLGLHIWFVNNARRVIIETVAAKSNGKLNLELSKLSFNFFNSELKVQHAKLISTDTLEEDVSYSIGFEKLSIKLGSFWPLLFSEEITIDSVQVIRPEIRITQLRRDTSKNRSDEEISIPRQMGKLYNSMIDGLDAFGIKRIEIVDAELSILNRLKPGNEPVRITHINFNLLRNAGSEGDEFIQNEKSVDLSTKQQDIAMPGGRHRLAFKSFNLNLFNKRMQLDSCTVTAIASDSTKSHYTIFFDKLLLVGVDFDAMYRHNLIKADSVYCEEPLFDIHINTSIAQSTKKERPDPEKIIQELTGDLDLAFIGVKHAGIKINISGKNNRSLFNSNKDDFEMRGLRIYSDSARPVVIDRFDMLVRDYRLYNEDSSATYTFDSIHFQNNKISLNNFWVTTTSSPGKSRSERDFRIPYFELTGLDWYQLIFEENLVATEAVLYNPIIRYVKRNESRVQKSSIFRSLRLLDNFMTLERISLVNGQLEMKLGPGTALNIQDANISLNKITGDLTDLREAVTRLSFTKAIFRLNDLNTVVYDASYQGDQLVHAGRIHISNKSRSIQAQIDDVDINNILVYERPRSVIIDGLKWRSAKFSINELPGTKKNGTNDFRLLNLYGFNTKLNYSDGEHSISTNLEILSADSIVKENSQGLQLNGMMVKGDAFDYKGLSTQVNTGPYQVSSQGNSVINQLNLTRIKDKDSIQLQTPLLRMNADMNDLLSGKIKLNEADFNQPVLRIYKNSIGDNDSLVQNNPFQLGRLYASQPDIKIRILDNDTITRFNFQPSQNSFISAHNFKIEDGVIEAGNAALQTNSFTVIKDSIVMAGVENGNVDLELSQFKFDLKSMPSWSLVVNRLHLVNPKSMKLAAGQELNLVQTSIGDLKLSSTSFKDPSHFIRDNISAWMRGTTGHYKDSNAIVRWHNAEYDPQKQSFTLDSFSYRPALSRDSFIARSEYQADYLNLHTGAISMSGFNLNHFEKDSSLIADSIRIHDPVLTLYRDKQLPYKQGVYKPLPVDIISRISMPVDVKQLSFINGRLSYTEKNAKTGAEGTLSLHRMDVQVSNIKNRSIDHDDSLSMIMNAWLMDSAFLDLKVRESYRDSLKGFDMTLRLKPTTVSFINPVLVPFTNVLITSGTIDSFHVRAIGREDLAIGEMQMYYHDLRIRMIKNGNMGKSSLGDRIANFLVNTFVIRKNNKGRTGLVYFERARDRSFFNYLVKITFSGMATSIGLKKNKKYIRQYRRVLEQGNLPEIVY